MDETTKYKKTNENDIQIMKLDDETGIAETYQKIDGADILKLESNPLNKDNSEKIDPKSTLNVATSPTRYYNCSTVLQDSQFVALRNEY